MLSTERHGASLAQGLIKDSFCTQLRFVGAVSALYSRGMVENVSRRTLMSMLAAGSLAALAACGSDPQKEASAPPQPPTSLPPQVEEFGVNPELLAVTVFKDPTCGCCGGWVQHAEDNGFTVAVEHPDALWRVFEEHEIAVTLQSCHLTLNSASAMFVGHVPIRFVLEYLSDPPEGSRGLSVPGMPIGTPGMEMEDQFDAYDVLLLLEDGSTEVFARVNEAAEQEL